MKFFRVNFLCEKYSISRVTLWRKARDPEDDFPAPMILGPNSIGWFEDEIQDWQESRPRAVYSSARIGTEEPVPALQGTNAVEDNHAA